MDTISIKNKKFTVERVIAEHEDHTTYLASWSGRTYFIRTYAMDYEKALADYKALKHAGINMAKMCFHDDVNHVVVYLYRFARFAKVALDWEPQNFMLRGNQMFYLPTKYYPMTEENRFERTGLTTWFLGKEGRALLKKKGFEIDNLPSLRDEEVNKQMTLMAVRYW